MNSSFKFASERVKVINAIKDNIRNGQTLDQIKSSVSPQNYDLVIEWLEANPCLRFIKSESRFLYNYERLSSLEEFELELRQRPIKITSELLEASYESFMEDLTERKNSFQVLEVNVVSEVSARQKKSADSTPKIGYKMLYLNPFYAYGFDMDYPIIPEDVLSWYSSMNYEEVIPTFLDIEKMLVKINIRPFNLACDVPRIKLKNKRKRRTITNFASISITNEKEVYNSEVAQLARKEFMVSKENEFDVEEEAGEDDKVDAMAAAILYNNLDHVEEWTNINHAVWMIFKSFYNEALLVIIGLFLEKKCYDEHEIEEKSRLPRKRVMDLLSTLWKHGLVIRGVSEVKNNEFSKRFCSKWEFSLNNFFNIMAYRLASLPQLIEEKIASLKNIYLKCSLCSSKFSLHDLANLRTTSTLEPSDSINDPQADKGHPLSKYLCLCSVSKRLEYADESELIARYSSILERSRGLFDPFFEIFLTLNQKKSVDSQYLPNVNCNVNDESTHMRTNCFVSLGRTQFSTNSKTAHSGTLNTSESAKSLVGAGTTNTMSLKKNSDMQKSTENNVIFTEGSELKDDKFDTQFNDYPLSINSRDEILLPIVESNELWKTEVGIEVAKLFLDSVAMFDRMSDGYYVYKFTRHSLYMSLQSGFVGSEIVRILTLLSGSPINATLFMFIMSECTINEYYRVSISLQSGQYVLQSRDESCIRNIVDLSNHVDVFETPGKYEKITIDGENEEPVFRIKLRRNEISLILELKRLCFECGYPVVESYEFFSQAHATSYLHLPIHLNSNVKVRDYQLLACSKLFWNRFNVHSGVLVLPCGAGKTLIGIAILSMIKKHTIIFCQSTLAVTQWRDSFLRWTNAGDRGKDGSYQHSSKLISRICKSYQNEWHANAPIIITTYPMFSSRTNRTDISKSVIHTITNREWGLMILDEVHQAPADVFQQVTSCFKVYTKLGLTATLVREDEKVKDLPFLVGPKLFELDIFTLLRQGHLAPVKCFEIQCQFTKYFQERYDAATDNASRERRLLYVTNLNKTRICYSLISKHLQQNHKVMVFCDDLFGLHWYHKMLNFDMIEGDTPEQQRELILKKFRGNNGSCILCSRVGDMSLDLPEAQVVIQLTILAGSRMQEGQRIGRVQRPHPSKNTAYFYSLITSNTQEEEFASKRRKYLTDHGYTVTVQSGEQVNQYYDSKTLVFYKDEQIVYNAIVKDLNNESELKKNKKNKNKRSSKSHTVLETQIKKIKLDSKF